MWTFWKLRKSQEPVKICSSDVRKIVLRSSPKTYSQSESARPRFACGAPLDQSLGTPIPRRVTRAYRNATTEWLRLRWTEGGAAREVVTTLGHHFLDALGKFPTTPEMTREGCATVVLASGAATQVTDERIICADAAPVFERAMGHGGGEGGGEGCLGQWGGRGGRVAWV